VTLDHEDIEAVARRTAELLIELQAVQPTELLDAAALASRLGISKAAVWRNARQLGGVQIGDGARPRWRFDLQTALRASQRDDRPTPKPQPPRRRPRQSSAPLLPVRP
jgi:hypothetical protein